MLALVLVLVFTARPAVAQPAHDAVNVIDAGVSAPAAELAAASAGPAFELNVLWPFFGVRI